MADTSRALFHMETLATDGIPIIIKPELNHKNIYNQKSKSMAVFRDVSRAKVPKDTESLFGQLAQKFRQKLPDVMITSLSKEEQDRNYKHQILSNFAVSALSQLHRLYIESLHADELYSQQSEDSDFHVNIENKKKRSLHLDSSMIVVKDLDNSKRFDQEIENIKFLTPRSFSFCIHGSLLARAVAISRHIFQLQLKPELN